jgi:hypothetical protein
MSEASARTAKNDGCAWRPSQLQQYARLPSARYGVRTYSRTGETVTQHGSDASINCASEGQWSRRRLGLAHMLAMTALYAPATGLRPQDAFAATADIPSRLPKGR